MTPEEIALFIDNANNSLISTLDGEGYPVTRAMLAVRLREGLDRLYFSTITASNKVKEIADNAKGSVYFFDPERFIGCLLKGHFHVTQCIEEKHKVWRSGDERYYPKGLDDDDFCVLIFSIDKGRTYANFTSANFT